MNNIIRLTSSKNTHTVFLNRENPVFKINKIVYISTMPFEGNDPPLIQLDTNMEYKLENTDLKSSITGAFQHERLSFPLGSKVIFEKDLLLCESDKYDQITITVIDLENDIEIEIHYAFFNGDIPVLDPFKNFAEHLKKSNNVKILFTSPFGTGKTTFLNGFFDNNNTYDVFRVFPVNYSISQNEDILKYIKVELLFQLLQRPEIEFKKEQFSYWLTAPKFFENKAHTVLAPFIKLLPSVGASAYGIYENLTKLASEFFEAHDNHQKDEAKSAYDFIKEEYEKEGSIFEDNFYTILIRTLLSQVKKKKKTVLVIDDTDRIDPEHIFRILNVFAAHFDTPEYNSEYSNKFGFDKIIIVGDYNNLKSIFTHKYGNGTDFQGYINKYYSIEPFKFDNKKAILGYLKKVLQANNPAVIGTFKEILQDFIMSNCISLRDILKLKKHDVDTIINESDHGDNYGVFYHPIIMLWLKVFDEKILIEKLKICKEQSRWSRNIKHARYNELVCLGLISIANKNYEFSLNGNKYTFTLINKQTSLFGGVADYLFADEIKSNELKNDKAEQSVEKFNKVDFYEMLISNTEKFSNTL